MKTTMKNFAMVMLAVIALASCQSEDPAPAIYEMSKITVAEGEYAIVYNSDSSVSRVEYTEGVDLTTYSMNWSANKSKLTVTIDEGGTDVVVNTFEYTNVLVNGEVKPVITKVVYDDEGDGGKTLQINYVAAPNQNVPSIIETMNYNFGMLSVTGDATISATSNSIMLDFSTNNETVKVNFDSNLDAWWTTLAPEVVAVLFENEFDYAYFLSSKEVMSIENQFTVKETSDISNTFAYTYYGDGRINTVITQDNNMTFVWTKK